MSEVSVPSLPGLRRDGCIECTDTVRRSRYVLKRQLIEVIVKFDAFRNRFLVLRQEE